MIQNISINPPDKVKIWTVVTVAAEGNPMNGFPFVSLDQNSYIVQAEVHSGINFCVEEGCHCIAIGKGSSLADGIVFIINLNHDYQSVFQGNLSFVDHVERKTPRKGSIIIQNDVWVGTNATIMAGVTLHNGCIVAAESVVTKDVPPYAIVGGNPAKVLRYRFSPDIIEALQRIAWWDWPEETQRARKQDFALPVEVFAEKYLPQVGDTGATSLEGYGPDTILFPVDVGEPFPLYPKVLAEYFSKDRPNVELLIYIPEELSTKRNIRAIEHILEQYEARDCFVTFHSGETLDERILFQGADYYVTTRSRDTVYRTCLADRYGVRILYGTDTPVFPSELQ